jgi:hypothetical protein
VNRFAIAALVVAFASSAHAETRVAAAAAPQPDAGKPEAAKEPAPDEIADIESQEANLETKAPRKGLTFAAAFGGGIVVGGDVGVGRGPTVSLRLGHVATRKTVITFELNRGDALHKASVDGSTLYDLNVALLAGAQRYTSRSLWVRAAGGPVFLTKNATSAAGTGGESPRAGVAGLIGAGFDIARWGYLVFGAELTGMASVTGDGIKAQGGFALGFSYY